ncbi:MAG: type IV pilus biogenesis/stability protein PilW [Pseudomonadota bacterium]
MRAYPITAMLCVLLAGCITEGGNPRTVKESPKDAAAYNYQLGVEYLRAGKLRAARERLESSVRQNPSVAATHFTLAILYERIDEPKLANRSYKDAIRMAPDDAAVQNSYAVYLCGQKKFSQAEAYFVDAAKNPLYGTPAAALTNAGVCMRQKPDLQAAEKYFREALRISREYPDALLELALLQVEKGNMLSARAFVQRLVAAQEPSADVLLLGWRVEKALGDDLAAADFADRLRESFPDAPQTRQVTQGG